MYLSEAMLSHINRQRVKNKMPVLYYHQARRIAAAKGFKSEREPGLVRYVVGYDLNISPEPFAPY